MIQLHNLTFILIDNNNKVVLAVSYENNAASLLNLLQNLDISNLYFVAHPEINNIGLIKIPEWTHGKIDFGISSDDLKVINTYFVQTGVPNGFIVNAIDCFDDLTRLSSYNTVRVWKDKFAYISVFNNELNTFSLFPSIDELLDEFNSKGVLTNVSNVLDTTKIRALHPELSNTKNGELLLLGMMLNSVHSKKVVCLPFTEDIPNIPQIEQQPTSSNESNEDVITSNQVQENDNKESNTDADDSLDRENAKNENESEKIKIKKEPKILVISIFLLSLLLGASFGIKGVQAHITALQDEMYLISDEIDLANENISFYNNQLKVISGERSETYKVYSDIKSIAVNGMLYSFTTSGDTITLIYYLLDETSLNTITDTLSEKYTIQSVTKTDILTVQNKAVNVYTITLTFV